MNSTITKEDNWEQMLLSEILVNQAMMMDESEGDGARIIRIALEEKWWNKPPFIWVFPFRNERKLRLDRLGSEVFDLCKSCQKVEEVVDLFAARHRLSFHESRLSVSLYLRTLVQQGVVVVKVPGTSR